MLDNHNNDYLFNYCHSSRWSAFAAPKGIYKSIASATAADVSQGTLALMEYAIRANVAICICGHQLVLKIPRVLPAMMQEVKSPKF